MSDLKTDELAKVEQVTLAPVAPAQDEETIQLAASLMVTGNLSGMKMEQKAAFLARLAQAERIPAFPPPYAIGINPATKKEQIISTKNRAESLRIRDGISIEPIYSGPMRLGSAVDPDYYEVEVKGTAKNGRTDTARGIVFTKGLVGVDKANKWLAADTKARNRVTNALSGSGLIDETEANDMGMKYQVVQPLQGPKIIAPPAGLTPGSASSTLGNQSMPTITVEATVVSEGPKPPVAAPKG